MGWVGMTAGEWAGGKRECRKRQLKLGGIGTVCGKLMKWNLLGIYSPCGFHSSHWSTHGHGHGHGHVDAHPPLVKQVCGEACVLHSVFLGLQHSQGWHSPVNLISLSLQLLECQDMFVKLLGIKSIQNFVQNGKHIHMIHEC